MLIFCWIFCELLRLFCLPCLPMPVSGGGDLRVAVVTVVEGGGNDVGRVLLRHHCPLSRHHHLISSLINHILAICYTFWDLRETVGWYCTRINGAFALSLVLQAEATTPRRIGSQIISLSLRIGRYLVSVVPGDALMLSPVRFGGHHRLFLPVLLRLTARHQPLLKLRQILLSLFDHLSIF